MAAKQTAQYGIAAVVIAIVIIGGVVGFASVGSVTPQTQQTSTALGTTQTAPQHVTTIPLGTSVSVTTNRSNTIQGQGNRGILSIYLKDAPSVNSNLKYLLVNVTSIELAYQGNNSTGAILTVPSELGTNVNVSSLQGQSLPLGGAILPAGTISSTFLHVSSAEAFYTDGSNEQLQLVANGRLFVPIQFGLSANGATDLTIDFMPNLANISQGGVLTPVIHALALEKRPNGATTETVTITENLQSTSTETTTQSVTFLSTVTKTVTSLATTTTKVTTPVTTTTTLTSPTTTTQTVTTTTGTVIVVTSTVVSPTTITTTQTSTTTVTSPTTITTTQTVTATTTASPIRTSTTTVTTTQTSTTTVTSPTTTTQTVTSTSTVTPSTTVTSTITKTSTTTETSSTTETSTATVTSTSTATTTVTVSTTTTSTKNHDSIAPLVPSLAVDSASGDAVSALVPAFAIVTLLVACVALFALPRFQRDLAR